MKIDEVTQRPKIYVLVGLPGSGKSTYTKNLMRDGEEYVVVSSDAFIERVAEEQGKTYSDLYKDLIGEATFRMKQDFKDGIRDNKNIVWDQTNMTKKKRRSILQQVPSRYQKICVVFDVDDAELFNRLREREKLTGKKIPEQVVKDMGAKYEAPSREEGFDAIIKVKS